MSKNIIPHPKTSAPVLESKKDKVDQTGKIKTVQELDREKLEKKFSKEEKEKLN